MFTGIIQSVGVISALQSKDGAVYCTIHPSLRRTWKIGESVAINGICSTITSSSRNSFQVGYMPHTISLTTVAYWKRGLQINIEPSLKVGDEISGHFVMGHVDGVVRIADIQWKSGETSITVQVPKKLLFYCIPRGSVALDGISLTIAKVNKNTITVQITPHTLAYTTLQHAAKGDALNLEIDLLARHLLWKQAITSKRKKRV